MWKVVVGQKNRKPDKNVNLEKDRFKKFVEKFITQNLTFFGSTIMSNVSRNCN